MTVFARGAKYPIIHFKVSFIIYLWIWFSWFHNDWGDLGLLINDGFTRNLLSRFLAKNKFIDVHNFISMIEAIFRHKFSGDFIMHLIKVLNLNVWKPLLNSRLWLELWLTLIINVDVEVNVKINLFILFSHFFSLLKKFEVFLQSTDVYNILRLCLKTLFVRLFWEPALHIKFPNTSRLNLRLCTWGEWHCWLPKNLRLFLAIIIREFLIRRFITICIDRQFNIEAVFLMIGFILLIFFVKVHKSLPKSFLFFLFNAPNFFEHFLSLIRLSCFSSLKLLVFFRGWVAIHHWPSNIMSWHSSLLLVLFGDVISVGASYRQNWLFVGELWRESPSTYWSVSWLKSPFLVNVR